MEFIPRFIMPGKPLRLSPRPTLITEQPVVETRSTVTAAAAETIRRIDRALERERRHRQVTSRSGLPGGRPPPGTPIEHRLGTIIGIR